MKSFFIALALLALTSCGTDTGNPGFRSGVPASGVGGTSFMVQAMCNKLSGCYSGSLNYNNCYARVFSANGMTGAMGLNTTTYPTLNAAYTGVVNGTIRVNQTTTDQCSSAITLLTCGDPLVTSAFSAGTPTNLDNAYQMLSASTACQNTVGP